MCSESFDFIPSLFLLLYGDEIFSDDVRTNFADFYRAKNSSSFWRKVWRDIKKSRTHYKTSTINTYPLKTNHLYPVRYWIWDRFLLPWLLSCAVESLLPTMCFAAMMTLSSSSFTMVTWTPKKAEPANGSKIKQKRSEKKHVNNKMCNRNVNLHAECAAVMTLLSE